LSPKDLLSGKKTGGARIFASADAHHEAGSRGRRALKKLFDGTNTGKLIVAGGAGVRRPIYTHI